MKFGKFRAAGGALLLVPLPSSRRLGRLRAAQGFSLVEVLVAMLIIGVIVAGLYGTFAHGFRTAQLAREDFRATQILHEKLDKIRLMTWDQLTDSAIMPDRFVDSFNPEDPELGASGLSSVHGWGSLGSVKGKNLVYAGIVTIQDGPADVTYGKYLKQVRIDLSWTSSTGLQRSRSIQTYSALYGSQHYDL